MRTSPLRCAMARDHEVAHWAALQPRKIPEKDLRRFEGYLREMIDATEGYEGDDKLVTSFPTECKGGPDCKLSQVIEGPIPFFSLCEHHALPFFGHAYV